MGNAAAGSRASATISRNGDLVSNCVLEVDITARSGRDAGGNNDINTKLNAGGMSACLVSTMQSVYTVH